MWSGEGGGCFENDPKTQHTARKQSLEGALGSTGSVLIEKRRITNPLAIDIDLCEHWCNFPDVFWFRRGGDAGGK